jgi:NADPH:quinone reductase-like Zn-dependent oxidoreductase
MPNALNPKTDPRQPMVYQIQIEGHLGRQWTDWFEGLAVTLQDNGDTLLTGPVIDQAALHGLLKKVRDLGMPLVSVAQVELHETPLHRSKKEKKMKAVVYTKYGSPDVLKIEEIEKPTLVENQVLIRVHAASINAGDYRMRKADPFLVRLMGGGLLRPKDSRLGWDVSGRVEAVGANVRQFQPGDAVFGAGNGTFAEYVCVREAALALKPGNISFEQAAAVPVAALTALQGLRDSGGIRTGQKVLIQGASGGVGMFAVQLAKSFGAEVTAVCSTRNLDMARSIGADHVIDYTREDFTRNRQRYDLILAVNGYHFLSAYKRALSSRGVYVCAGGTMPQIFQAMLLGSLMSRKGGQKMGSMGIAKVTREDLVYLGELLQAGKIIPVIDRHYPLSEITGAFRYVEDKHAQGKVVITMEHRDTV